VTSEWGYVEAWECKERGSRERESKRWRQSGGERPVRSSGRLAGGDEN